ncbi:MAG: hypothetical protein H3C31_07185 [Brumimicrobium sp.]|nr:hypothetical protein [Brumimicrobium sp.]
MKRIVLIGLVSVAVIWIAYSSYQLWINNDSQVNPQYVFCEQDQGVLLINNYNETKNSDYLKVVASNPLANSLENLDSIKIPHLRIYASQQRAIIIFEKENSWKKEEIDLIYSQFKLTGVESRHEGPYLMFSKDYTACNHNLLTQLREADKKASANFWKYNQNQWSRTDMYNLNNGYFEYRSSNPTAIYGEAIQDIPLFASVIPYTADNYSFHERFYAEKTDSIFEIGPMNDWVDKGFVVLEYEGASVIISDYRSQQTPRLILIEQSKQEDSVNISDEIYSFSGFQLTNDFPSQKNKRIYITEIEDKVIITESKSITQKLLVEYQLGKTLALNPEKMNYFFGGLPSFTNHRFVSNNQKRSITWKNHLLFEVSTEPPGEQLVKEDKTSWSASVNHTVFELVPIYDHLRGGISVLSYSEDGKYELVSSNGKSLWRGDADGAIQGEVRVIDVFDNNKHQFLFRTKKRVHLIDLNGKEVGGFPYLSDNELTTSISDFVWNGTKRFLVGTEKGEVIMLNSAGQELTIIKVGNSSVIQTPYALNIKGKLTAWVVNKEHKEYLGFLEKPGKPVELGSVDSESAVKYNGKVVNYFEKEGEVYCQKSDVNGLKGSNPIPIEKGKIFTVTNDYIVIVKSNNFSVFTHDQSLLYTKTVPFNEVGSFVYLKNRKECVVLDNLQNKIHAYSSLGEEVTDFPKEGRELVVAETDKDKKQVYIFSKIAQSIICYKYK